jgi:DNA-binding MurR/RpiR family transcriptional regulator
MMDDLRSTVFIYSQAPMQKIRDSIHENEPLENILQKVVEQGVENLALRKFTPLNDTFMKVARFMVHAENIYLVGARSSYCVVQYGGFYLSTMAKNIHYFSSSSETRYERLDELTERDVVFVVSFHRYYKDTVDAAAFAKKKRALVVGITDSILSPIAIHCDEILLVPSTAPFSSYIPSIAVMEALILAFTQAKGAEVKKVLDERMELLLQNNVYAEIE